MIKFFYKISLGQYRHSMPLILFIYAVQLKFFHFFVKNWIAVKLIHIPCKPVHSCSMSLFIFTHQITTIQRAITQNRQA